MIADKTVYIVDDNHGFLESTAWMLEGDGYQVKSFSDPATLLNDLSEKRVNKQGCILLDVRMPTMSGLDFHDRLLESSINIPVIYMTGHGDVALAVEAMKKGAVTFLEKPLEMGSLKSALGLAFEESSKQDALQRGAVLDKKERDSLTEKLALLTRREMEVAECVARGELNKVVAFNLGISIKTVEKHRSSAMTKLQAKNSADLVKIMVLASSA